MYLSYHNSVGPRSDVLRQISCEGLQAQTNVTSRNKKSVRVECIVNSYQGTIVHVSERNLKCGYVCSDGDDNKSLKPSVVNVLHTVA